MFQNMFLRMTIRTRLIVAFSALLTLMCVTTTLSIDQMHRMNQARERMVRGSSGHNTSSDRFERLALAQRGIALVNENARRALELFLISGQHTVDAALFKRVFDEQKETTRQISATYKEFEGTLDNAAERELFDKVKAARFDYVTTRNEIEKEIERGRGDESLAALNETILPKLAVYLKAWRTLLEFEQKQAIDADVFATRQYLLARNYAIALLIGSVLCALAIAFGVTRYITRSLHEIEVALANLREENALRRDAENRLRIYAEVFGSTSENVIIASDEQIVVEVNPAYLSTTGFSREDVIGAKLLQHSRQVAVNPPIPDWRAAVSQVGAWHGELLVERSSGEHISCLAYINKINLDLPHGQSDGKSYLVCICHDISESRKQAAQLEYQATHDALTSLPNRTLLLDRLALSIKRAARTSKRVGLMFIDLDKFKNINDTLGHSAGDALLVQVAERLTACVRKSDTTARLGGDEFVVLVDEIIDENEVSRLAQRMADTLSAPMALAGEDHTITCSIGISMFPEDGTDHELLMKHADIAMYRAKETGRNNIQFFKSDMQTRIDERIALERHLQLALDREEFLLHFQPQVDLRTGKIIGFEALIRWNSPEFGMVPPGRFIPVAEESNLILAIGEWVLHTACAQVGIWKAQGLNLVPVSVNVAALQFSRQRIDLMVSDALRQARIDASLLDVELTESLSMADPDASIAIMRRLKDMGISISIDDFGTGYSNLGYLKRFPVDRLKLDQSFVRNLSIAREEQAIVKAIIEMAHALNLQVIAEGVETASQLQLLAMLGCDEMQGYYFSKPVLAQEAAQLLADRATLDPRHLTRKRVARSVLLVDDDPLVVSMLRLLLREECDDILTAASATEAYELLAGNEIGVILADCQMPLEDGITFLTNVRHMYPGTVRILLTGDASSETLSTAINRSEIFRFISKPWKVDHIRATLRDAFQKIEESRGRTTAIS